MTWSACVTVTVHAHLVSPRRLPRNFPSVRRAPQLSSSNNTPHGVCARAPAAGRMQHRNDAPVSQDFGRNYSNKLGFLLKPFSES